MFLLDSQSLKAHETRSTCVVTLTPLFVFYAFQVTTVLKNRLIIPVFLRGDVYLRKSDFRSHFFTANSTNSLPAFFQRVLWLCRPLRLPLVNLSTARSNLAKPGYITNILPGLAFISARPWDAWILRKKSYHRLPNMVLSNEALLGI